MSDPGFTFGQVPTAAQWNNAFGTKQDVLGFTPVNRAGDNMGGKLVTTASIAGTAGFAVPPGVAPSVPVNGDIWLTNTGVFAQVNGSSVQLATGGAVNSAPALQLAYYAGSGAAISGNANLTVFNGALTLGTPGSNPGSVILSGLASGGVTLAGASAGGSGTITFPAGTVNFGATGGPNQVVQQTSVGGIFTVGQLSVSNLSNGTLGSGSVILASTSTGTGAIVFANTPTLITPVLTTPTLNGTATAQSIAFSPTTGGIVGTTTNNNTSAGNVGEYVPSTVLIGSGVVLSTGIAATITSISLTAGDWDVWGSVAFNPAGSTTITQLIGAINTTAATLPTLPGAGAMIDFNLIFATGVAQAFPVGQTRLSLAITTTIFLVAQAAFGASTMAAYGVLAARRVR